MQEESDEPLKVSSVFGSAKATQEADNIIILQNQKHQIDNKIIGLKYIEVYYSYNLNKAFNL